MNPTLPPVLPAECCANCARGLQPVPDGHNKHMIDAGWLRCDCMPDWCYRSPFWNCDFGPSRWIKKPEPHG